MADGTRQALENVVDKKSRGSCNSLCGVNVQVVRLFAKKNILIKAEFPEARNVTGGYYSRTDGRACDDWRRGRLVTSWAASGWHANNVNNISVARLVSGTGAVNVNAGELSG